MGLIQRFKQWREKRNEKWHIIDNFHELPIGVYLDIIAVGKSEGEDIDKSTQVLRLLTGWSEEDIENLPIASYSALTSGCAWLYENIAYVPVVKEYRVGRWVLRNSDARTITTAQYIDFQAYVKDSDRYIVELLSTLLIPKGKRYNEGYDIAEVQEAIRRYLPTDTALSLVAFFLKSAQESIANILRSSERDITTAPAKTEEEKKTKEEALITLRNLLKNGGGLPT